MQPDLSGKWRSEKNRSWSRKRPDSSCSYLSTMVQQSDCRFYELLSMLILIDNITAKVPLFRSGHLSSTIAGSGPHCCVLCWKHSQSFFGLSCGHCWTRLHFEQNLRPGSAMDSMLSASCRQHLIATYKSLKTFSQRYATWFVRKVTGSFRIHRVPLWSSN